MVQDQTRQRCRGRKEECPTFPIFPRDSTGIKMYFCQSPLILDQETNFNGSMGPRCQQQLPASLSPGSRKERYLTVQTPLTDLGGGLHVTAGFPKALLEGAVARGQGKSASGATLESITLEVIVPPTVAMIIESETDNRARTLMDLRYIVKRHGGSVTPTGYLFQKKGRIAFEADETKGVDDVLDDAIEAGAEDVEADEDGSIVVWTEPSQTTAAAEALLKSHGLKVESADILWDANEDTKVPLESEDAVTALSAFIAELRENSNVQGVYANVAQGSISDEVWEELQDKLDS